MQLPLTPIRCLYRGVDLYGKKEGVVSGERRFTYAQFGERCERLAAGLLALGVKPGDRVAYLSFNNNQLLEGYYGPAMIRAIVMPLNVRLTPAELIQILNHSGAVVLIFENEFAPLIEAFHKACPGVKNYVSIDGPTPQANLTYEELLKKGRIDPADWTKFDENEIAELFYTSGSTGTPKGVALSHRTLYLHALGILGSSFKEDTNVDLHTIPLFHANGWGAAQFSVMTGSKQVMVRRFEPSFVFRLIESERATHMGLVPVMANALLHSPDLGKFDFSSLKEIMLGGAASSPELLDRLEKAFKCKVLVGYGLTETSPMVSTSRLKSTVSFKDDKDRIFHSAMAGWPGVGVEVRVVDSEMKDVPRDGETMGEIVVRSDNVMDGYFKEPEATHAVMTGAWFHTGDMAVWDEETYLHIVDRKKDIIISGGENISSIEVEKAIFAHPSVFECAVVAAPDPKWGEIPVATVVLNPGHQLTSEELLAFLEQRLAKFKLPRLIHFSEQQLPKTGTGKILKREIRDIFWLGKERKVQGG
jgi:acyl-CoA synthetase (AMP-forming)/AMP-acid ligase II